MYPVIQLGNVSVSVYALLIVAGIAAGCIAMRPFSASFGIEKEDALYATLFGVLGAAVCGKLAYVLVSLAAWRAPFSGYGYTAGFSNCLLCRTWTERSSPCR